MNAIHTPAATASGIACAKCSHWSNGRKIVVHHATVADVKACHQTPATRPVAVVSAVWDKIAEKNQVPATCPACGGSLAVEPHDPTCPMSIYPVPTDAARTAAAPVDWIAMERAAKNAAVQHEAAQERAAYQAKMDRDDALALTWASKKESIKPGRYAVEIDGTLKFYKIDRPTEGRWAGRTFVSVQASDELFPVRNRTAREEILALVAVDPEAAMRRYGREIGRCGHCNRTLTDETSRRNGIGPICADKGW